MNYIDPRFDSGCKTEETDYAKQLRQYANQKLASGQAQAGQQARGLSNQGYAQAQQACSNQLNGIRHQGQSLSGMWGIAPPVPLQSDSGDAQPEQPSPSIDWNAVFAVPEEQAIQESTRQELVARDLKVKCETPEERERLWNLVKQYSI